MAERDDDGLGRHRRALLVAKVARQVQFDVGRSVGRWDADDRRRRFGILRVPLTHRPEERTDTWLKRGPNFPENSPTHARARARTLLAFCSQNVLCTMPMPLSKWAGGQASGHLVFMACGVRSYNNFDKMRVRASEGAFAPGAIFSYNRVCSSDRDCIHGPIPPSPPWRRVSQVLSSPLFSLWVK